MTGAICRRARPATLQVLERPVVEPLAELVERRRWDLLKLVRLPACVEVRSRSS